MRGRDGSDNSQQSLGICQRLFNLFMNSFIAQRLKRITMGSTIPHGSNEVPTESKSGDGEPGKLTEPNGNLGSEIIVEFRHTNGVGNWISLDNQIGGVLMERDEFEERKKGKGIDHHQVVGIGIEPAARVEKETHAQELNVGKGPKTSVSVKEISEREREKNKKKLDDNVPRPPEAERLTLAIQPAERQGQGTNPRPPRHVRPLLSVTSNINEKSGEFIRRRKEAMSKNLQL